MSLVYKIIDIIIDYTGTSFFVFYFLIFLYKDPSNTQPVKGFTHLEWKDSF